VSTGPSKPPSEPSSESPGKPSSESPGKADDRDGGAGEGHEGSLRPGRKRRITLGDWPPTEHTPAPGTRPGVDATAQTREFQQTGQDSGHESDEASALFDADAIELDLDRDLGSLELALPGDVPGRAATGAVDDWSGPTMPSRETAARKGLEVEPTRDMDHHAFAELTLDYDSMELDGGEDDALDGDWPDDPELIERRLIDELDIGAPAGESPSHRERRRVSALIEQAHAQYIEDRLDVSVIALDLTWAESPDSVVSQKLIQEHCETICEIYEAYIGDTEAVLAVAVSMSELRSARVDPRAAFLLSRIDGMLTAEELLDVAGMSRVETLRYLCALLAKGLVKRA
jgi:hypothetical protein